MFGGARRSLTALLAVIIISGLALVSTGRTTAVADSSTQVDLRVLLIGLTSGDPVTQAWESELTAEGVPYTLVLPQGSSLTLPNLVDPNNADHGLYDGVVLIPSTYQFSFGTLGTLWSYESAFGVRQIDGYVYPAPALQGIGYDSSASTDLSDTTPTLTTAGLAAFPALQGPVPLDASTYGYPSTVQASNSDTVTPLLQDANGDTLIAVDQHPVPDNVTGQSGVSEMAITFDYGPGYTSWLVLAPSLIDWLTDGVHLGLTRNYIEMDIDDTFTPDNAWSTSTHSNDYTDADSLRMSATDVVNAAQWSQANGFRMDQLFNGGGSVAYQNGNFVPRAARARPVAGAVPNHGSDHRRTLRRRLRLDQPYLRHARHGCRLRHPELHRSRTQREHELGGVGTGCDAGDRWSRTQRVDR